MLRMVLALSTCLLTIPLAFGETEASSEADARSTEIAVTEDADGRVQVEVSLPLGAIEVADHIRRELSSAQVIVDGQNIWVEGVDGAQIRAALRSLDVEPQLDDVDRLLATVREISAIEANREEQIEDMPSVDGPLLTATVRTIQRQRFPLVFIGLDVVDAPEGAPVQAQDRIVVLPRVHSQNGLVDPDDRASKLNVGAWYAKVGDTVELVLEPQPDNRNIYVAAMLRRVR
ncbi:MAG: hypothetical protein ACFB9M_14005 [Myxococcota bacterium]